MRLSQWAISHMVFRHEPLQFEEIIRWSKILVRASQSHPFCSRFSWASQFFFAIPWTQVVNGCLSFWKAIPNLFVVPSLDWWSLIDYSYHSWPYFEIGGRSNCQCQSQWRNSSATIRNANTRRWRGNVICICTIPKRGTPSIRSNRYSVLVKESFKCMSTIFFFSKP